MNRIINFIKYHNLVPIILGVILLATAGAFANEDVRNAVIGQEIITEQGIDNSQILAADLDNFDFRLTIQNISEDPKNYYIDYTFYTLAIRDYIWQPVLRQQTMTVAKEALGERDLGLYVVEELGELIDYQLSYLKEVQEIEREKGQTQIVQNTTYTGLIGLVLNPKTKELPGYEPVVKEVKEGTEITGEYTSPQETPGSVSGEKEIVPSEPQVVQAPIDRDLIRQIVQEILAQQQNQPPPTTETTPTEMPPACQPLDETCDGIDNDCDGLVDEGGVCEPTEEPPAEDVCDATHLNLCTTQELCEGVSLYWYNETCNNEPAAPACVPNWQCSDWQPLSEITACGQTFTQTRTCADLNNCGTDEGKPIESRDTTGNLCSAQNATGTCQLGSCTFICQEGFSDCDPNIPGCETATSTCP